jgi:hypothetical protein
MNRRFLALCLLLAACDDAPNDPTTIVPPEAGVDGATDAGVDAVVDAAPASDAAPRDAAPADATPADAAPLDMAVDAGVVIECGNDADDDGDGRTDYPDDPGCESAGDLEEADPAQPACRNGQDDDANGLTDHPDDPGCASPDDPSEASACGGHVARDISALRRVEGTTVGEVSELQACRDNRAPEAVFLFTLRTSVETLHFDTLGSTFDTLLQVKRACDDASEVACNDDVQPGERTSAVDIDRPALGDYYVIIDGFLEEQGAYTLNIRASVRDGADCPEGDGPVQCRAGALCFEGECVPARCANGIDDDRDGRTDFPNEPGCLTLDDDDEIDPVPLPECSDGQDNDGSGFIDYPNDPWCDHAADPDEQRPPACSDREDNDFDGRIDLADPGCMGNPNGNNEFSIEHCRDGQDNDADGVIDYPNDPGCTGQLDEDETNPVPPPQCADGIDNDNDGLTDYPNDAVSCLFAADDTEDDPCQRREPTEITGLSDVRGTTAELPNDFEPSCQRNTSADDVLLWRVAEDRPLRRLVLSTRGSDFDTVLAVRDRCDQPREDDLECDDDGAPLGTSIVRISRQNPGAELWIFIDGGYPGAQGIWRLSVTAELAEGANCAGRGAWVCADGLVCREEGAAQRCRVAACDNERDDDRDGVIDFPAEVGCASASDDDEADPPVAPVCSNGVDDDADGTIDFPQDANCTFAADAFEGPDCRDGVDNDGDDALDFDRDGDGFRDRNGDPGCACNDDLSEDVDRQCDDGCDNDRDGLVDLADPGCANDPNRDSEFNVAQCRDGIDNNADGRIDFPGDPGCSSRNDPLEDTQNPLPACANGVDDDADGLIDFAQGGGGDDGCSSAADTGEGGPCDGELPAFPDNGQILGNTAVEGDNHDSTCRPGDAPDVAFRARVPYLARVEVTSEGSDFDTVVYARTECRPLTTCPEDEPMCVPASTEIACEDDVVGAQGVVEFDWDGGDFYAFLDGFGSASGNYRLAIEAVYRRGGQCGPEVVGYARCPAGFECRPDEAAGFPTCQAR